MKKKLREDRPSGAGCADVRKVPAKMNGVVNGVVNEAEEEEGENAGEEGKSVCGVRQGYDRYASPRPGHYAVVPVSFALQLEQMTASMTPTPAS